MAARSLCLALLDQGPELSNSDAIGAMDDFIHFVVQKKLGDSNRQNAAASKQLMESLVRACVSAREGHALALVPLGQRAAAALIFVPAAHPPCPFIVCD